MALYSVPDWRHGKYRVYRSPELEGLFDPEVPKLPVTEKNLGFCIEDSLVSLPGGCQFIGLSDRALGRVCNDAESRRQATAKLPEGIGSVEGGTGGMGIIPFVPFLGLGASPYSSWYEKIRPLVPIAFAFTAGVLIIKGLQGKLKFARARVKRSRNTAKLRPGQRWRRGPAGNEEYWRACEGCARPLGPANTKAQAERLSCRVCDSHRGGE